MDSDVDSKYHEYLRAKHAYARDRANAARDSAYHDARGLGYSYADASTAANTAAKQAYVDAEREYDRKYTIPVRVDFGASDAP